MITDFRQHFNFTDEFIQLNNAGMPPLMTAAQLSFAEDSRRLGEQGYGVVPDFIARAEKARVDSAKLLGTTSERVAFVPNFATGASIFAHSFPWRSGDRILSLAEEYPSNAYIWNEVSRLHSVDLTLHPLTDQKTVVWSNFIRAIQQARPAFRLVAISWVQSETGVMAPLAEIAEACQRVGTQFFVDGIQGLGAFPFHMQNLKIDYVCTGSHKWLCGPPGHGLLAFRDDQFLEFRPPLHGAMTYGTPDDPTDFHRPPVPSARKFEPGAGAFLQVFAAHAALKTILHCSEEKIAQDIRSLRESLCRELESLDFQILGERETLKSGGIVTFRSQKKSVVEMSTLLSNQKVLHAAKRTGLRLSPHAFNTEDELQKVVRILKDGQC